MFSAHVKLSSRSARVPLKFPASSRDEMLRTSRNTALNDSILYHIFLPCHLPKSSADDFLAGNDHHNEYQLLQAMRNFLMSLEGPRRPPGWSVLLPCISRWTRCQHPNNVSPLVLQEAIDKLKTGDYFPLYFTTHNAALLIAVEPDQSLISAWQVQLSTRNITASLMSHFSCFPAPLFELPDRSELRSAAHCELLLDLLRNSLEYRQAYRNSRSFDETRDITMSHYVTDWWINHFQRINPASRNARSIPFRKKHRDQIRWKDADLPFRRSGLWMVIKTVLQTILADQLGQSARLVYKLLITSFLTDFLHARQLAADCTILNVDLLMHCLKKITRRLNKIRLQWNNIEQNEVARWTEHAFNDIELKLRALLPNCPWQTPIEQDKDKRQRSLKIPSNIADITFYAHSCPKLAAYFSESNSSQASQSWASQTQHNALTFDQSKEELPAPRTLTSATTENTGIVLTIVEHWLEKNLDPWMEGVSMTTDGARRFQDLLELFVAYQRKALEHYYSSHFASDSFGYTRFVLASLTILRSLHRKLCAEPRFQRLASHSIDIPHLFQLVEFLSLPTREEMLRARELIDYFRDFHEKPLLDILSNIESSNAFGVHFASLSTEMRNTLQQIRDEAERDKQAKTIEVRHAKQRYDQIMARANALSCDCVYEYKYSRRGVRHRYCSKKCERCRLLDEAKGIIVEIYECPIPSNEHSALAVVFELQMPAEFRCYREVLWQFINRPQLDLSVSGYQWLQVSPHQNKLRRFYTGGDNHKVKLISSRESLTQTHYSRSLAVGSYSLGSYLHENHLFVQISQTRPAPFSDECRILTPQLDHADYKSLQFALNSTECEQNRVLAQSIRCPSGLKASEFIEFGSFRSGQRLQWWNLLSALESDSLSFDEESVVLLLTHSLMQNGPMADEPTDPWCPNAHRVLFNDHFVDELVIRLERRLQEYRSNWQNATSFLVIAIVTMRVLTLCNATRTARLVELACKCREAGEESIEKISQTIQKIDAMQSKERAKLRDKIVLAATASLFTFALHPLHQPLSNSSIVSLLNALTSIHDHLLLNKQHSSTPSVFLRNLLRWRDRILVDLQPAIAQFLHDTAYQSLHQFTEQHWPVIRTHQWTAGSWHKQSSSEYEGQYGSVTISIDSFRGRFAVNGVTVSYLPSNITAHALFQRTFGNHVFEVEAGASPNSYVSKPSGLNKDVYFEFELVRRLIVRERRVSGQTLELIPHDCLRSDFAEDFVESYSHWFDRTANCIYFRPIRFDDEHFLTKISYVLGRKQQCYLIDNTPPHRFVVNRSSPLFQMLFQRYFRRLDDERYVFMLTFPNDSFVDIHLSRLSLGFRFDVQQQKIFSREYSEMFIDVKQCFGTFTGLTAGLLLSSNRTDLARKFLVPFGKITCTQLAPGAHQSVFIERTPTTEFAQHYFVFTLNDHLRLVLSSDSPTGCLYLALLHAMTSHPLVDIYTGLTGMERAFQILHSAACWTDQPYDSLSLNILRQLASLSPRVDYYPTHLTSMATIQWNHPALAYSQQHFGYYLLVTKMLHASEQLNFLYPTASSNSNGLPRNNVKLLTKFYQDYRDSYNPTGRLSDELEQEMVREYPSYSYEDPPSFDRQLTDGSPCSPMEDLYATGDVNLTNPSTITCFPLNRWLNEDHLWKNDFLALLQCIHSKRDKRDDYERFQILLDFLHYNSKKRAIKPFYLTLLKTILINPLISLDSIPFPPFGAYKNIDRVQVHRESLPCSWLGITEEKSEGIYAEVDACFRENRPYADEKNFFDSSVMKASRIKEINELLQSWHRNEELRQFLHLLKTLIDSISSFASFSRLLIARQQIIREAAADHHRIEIRSHSIPSDPRLLDHARRKFCQPHLGDLIPPRISTQLTAEPRPFPDHIFPSTDHELNPLSDIARFFQTELKSSWQKFQSVQRFQHHYESVEHIVARLTSTRQDSDQLWIELIRSIRTDNELLIDAGLTYRLTPGIFVPLLHQIWLEKSEQSPTKRAKIDRSATQLFTDDQYVIFGGVLVNWIVEQQLQRTISCLEQNRREDFEREVSSTPHANWTPSEHVPWLIFELEMNLTIRKVQVEVARHLIAEGRDDGNFVMQMNMGEGKTSVIVPMLALSLCSPCSSFVRIVVLKSLMTMNYQSLRSKLGGLLNRRIFPFVCRREMNFDEAQIKRIFDRFQQGLTRRDVLLTAPEYLLSFDLLTIDQCRRQQFAISRAMLRAQRWLKQFARDVLDESDEILHVKYQLVYTIGSQHPVDGGALRWKTVQTIFELVKKHAEQVVVGFPEDVVYGKTARSSHFPSFRLLTERPFESLAAKIVDDWLTDRCYRQEDRQLLRSFLLCNDNSMECVAKRFSPDRLQEFLIVRGLLASQVLLVALSKRHRVQFGVNADPKFDRLMAVPFRAKDVAAENTEFGHPDIAIVLTHLYYYYEGLTNEQMRRCLQRLDAVEKHPEEIYQQWVDYEGDVVETIKRWDDINLKDEQQINIVLFPVLRKNMFVINYFLSHFVFPQEAKQFPAKLISSAWDLSSDDRTHVITGFSGTNDTQLLLPVRIQQCDLPQLKATDALVLHHLLRKENEFYRTLPIGVTTDEILDELVHDREHVNVIIDVGALFVDGNNRQIAMQWLAKCDAARIEYAVYFQSDSLYVCDRRNCHSPFNTSPASERPERCVFYLDEVHTRGTDLKFPNGFRAAVTLGHGLTKDRFVQACMRMRRLDKGHSLKFCSSNEVDKLIRMSKETADGQEDVGLIDILRWVYLNTQQATWDGLRHWAAQSLAYQRKVAAFRHIQWRNAQQTFNDTLMVQLFEECREDEVLALSRMYGTAKSLQRIVDIHRARCHPSGVQVSSTINDVVLGRLQSYGGSKTLLAQSFDEEQEREFEREVEQEVEQEQQREEPSPPVPHGYILHDEIKQLASSESATMNLLQYPHVFLSLPQAFVGTSFFAECQPSSWRNNLWISSEFQRVIQSRGETLDSFLRPARWLMVYRDAHLIFVSPFEANWLMGQLTHHPSESTLRLLLPRMKRHRSIFINTAALTIPRSFFSVPAEWLAELSVFNGTLYFDQVDQQRAYCQFLGVCPKPRTAPEATAFEQGWIANDGFVPQVEHRRCLQLTHCRFNLSPLQLCRRILESRHRSHVSPRSHVGAIILEANTLLS